MEVEPGAVLVVHVGGEEVEEDADVLAVGEGDGDGGLRLGGGAGGGSEDGRVVLLAGLLDEAAEQGGGVGAFAMVFDADVEGKRWGVGCFCHEWVFFIINKVKKRGFRRWGNVLTLIFA